MVTLDDMQLISRTGPGTSMGNLIRRYWIPALLTEELPEPDGDPKQIRLLGEDLVAFRDTSGQVGIVGLNCPHRGASLALGRNEEGGLRCLYHGWKIDVNGRVLDTPCEPPNSRFKDRIRHRAYPTIEAGDIVWVYMGTEQEPPPLPDFPWISVPAGRRSVAKMWQKCSYLQGLEGVLDSYHASVLHSGYHLMHWTPEQIFAATGRRPSDSARAAYGVTATFGEIQSQVTDYGFQYAAARTSLSGSDLIYYRLSEFVFPFSVMVPPPISPQESASIWYTSNPFIFVPIDDYNCWFMEIVTSDLESVPDDPDILSRPVRPPAAPDKFGNIDHDQHVRERNYKIGVDLTEDYKPVRNAANNFLQDREMMRQKKDARSFSGIDTAAQPQDQAVLETMGAVLDRFPQENLCSSDGAIIKWREHMADIAKTFEKTGAAPGQQGGVNYRDIRASSSFMPPSADWQQARYDRRHEFSF
jgi:phthalate 4,5-dioxygenase oxygenase subunit